MVESLRLIETLILMNENYFKCYKKSIYLPFFGPPACYKTNLCILVIIY